MQTIEPIQPTKDDLLSVSSRLRKLSREAEALAAMTYAMSLALDTVDTPAEQQPAPAQWYTTADNPPRAGQKVIVKTSTGEQYFLTYPFSAVKYPKWWVIPEED